MDDLISRAAAIEAIKPLLYSGNCVSTLINMPAVDAAPVVHGHWIDQCGDFECSECHTLIDSEALWYYRNSNYQPRDDDFAYCPSCGAKMDGERRDSE